MAGAKSIQSLTLSPHHAIEPKPEPKAEEKNYRWSEEKYIAQGLPLYHRMGLQGSQGSIGVQGTMGTPRFQGTMATPQHPLEVEVGIHLVKAYAKLKKLLANKPNDKKLEELAKTLKLYINQSYGEYLTGRQNPDTHNPMLADIIALSGNSNNDFLWINTATTLE